MRKKKFINGKVKNKITSAIVACSIISTLLVGGVSLASSSRIIKLQAEKNLSLIAENKANEFNAMISRVENSVQTLAATINSSIDIEKFDRGESYIEDYERSIEKIVKGFAETTDGAIGAYFYINPELTKGVYGVRFVDEKNDGKFVAQPLETIDEFTPENKDMYWYYATVKAKKALWLDPYVDSQFNVYMISYVVPIYKNEILAGVVGMDINFDNFRRIVKSTDIYDTGNVALVNQKYDFLVPPSIKHKGNTGFFERIKAKYFDKKVEKVDSVAQASQQGGNGNFAEMNNGSLKFLTEEIDKKQSGTINYKYENLDKILAYSHLSNGYIMLIDVPQVEVLRQMNSVVVRVAFMMLIGIILSLIVGWFIGGAIGSPIVKVAQLVDKIAKLDLTDDNSFEVLLKRRDEVGLITKSVENMRGYFRSTVEEIMNGAEKIANHSNSLANAMNETTMSINEISMTTSELASGASHQAAVAQEGLSKLMYLAREIQNVTTNSSIVKEHIDETDKFNKKAILAVENLQKQFNNNNDITREISKSIDLLASRSESISDILTAIKYVAEQTKLLALNAAIEAARAGETGRGFAVVADEIRKLSEQTSISTTDIENIIEGIKQDIAKTRNKMDIANKIVDESNRALGDTSESFRVIDKAVKNMFERINSLVESVEKMDNAKKDVVTSIEEIYSITEESVAATEEVSNTIESQSITINDVSKATEDLKEIALNLKRLIEQFKIK
ncbi:methyl-accepting chemotaxis protein [Fonticella tunisiensis]|uniref:Methyl-accepting chemotaxis sensory transducer with Cache sensor n=1 Tax=Fonticella tunisiensis TaxID=1096341 RepID=A0A4R7KSH3_9CLOT|nr:methyl-accepting chemotaxis protein [Fonticella tunisiensis]TDT62757.1 methyl-accepting chemotaxis sensory transducer with Cache sensor [Fonticella tunisiensis]